MADIDLRDRVAAVRGLAEPLHRLAIILRRSLAVVVQETDVELRERMTLIRGLAEPLHRLDKIRNDGLAL